MNKKDNKKKGTSKMANLSKYEKSIKPQFNKIQNLLMEGYSRSDVAKSLGISRSGLYKYMDDYPEFKEFIEKSEQNKKNLLKPAMLKTALGGYFVEEEKVIIDNSKGKAQVVRKEITKRYIPPSVTMQIFLAKNYFPDEFKDRHEIEHSGSISNTNIDLSNLTEEELRSLAKMDKSTTNNDS